MYPNVSAIDGRSHNSYTLTHLMQKEMIHLNTISNYKQKSDHKNLTQRTNIKYKQNKAKNRTKKGFTFYLKITITNITEKLLNEENRLANHFSNSLAKC